MLAAACGPPGREAELAAADAGATLAGGGAGRAAPPRRSCCWRGRSAPSGSTATSPSGASVELEIDGDDLIAAGLDRGPALGRGLAAALAAKLDGEVSGREQELACALAAAEDGETEMPGLIHDIDPARVRANLGDVRAEIGPDVEVLVACKYVPLEEMGALAEAGVTLVGENRQQDLAAKQERWGDAFTWDFIGNLQSRKVKLILPQVRLIHSVATDSVARPARQARHPRDRGPDRGQRRRRGGEGGSARPPTSPSSSSAARSGSAG